MIYTSQPCAKIADFKLVVDLNSDEPIIIKDSIIIEKDMN
jgi:hypothetical protein